MMIRSGEGHQANHPKDEDEDEDEDVDRGEEGQRREDASDDKLGAVEPGDDSEGPDGLHRSVSSYLHPEWDRQCH